MDLAVSDPRLDMCGGLGCGGLVNTKAAEKSQAGGGALTTLICPGSGKQPELKFMTWIYRS